MFVKALTRHKDMAYALPKFSISFNNDLTKSFPYKFKNEYGINDTTSNKNLQDMEEFIIKNRKTGHEAGFAYAYKAFLMSLVNKDYALIKQATEVVFGEKVDTQLKNLTKNTPYSLQLLNDNKYNMKMKLVDYEAVIASSPNRDLKELIYKLNIEKPNLSVYLPLKLTPLTKLYLIGAFTVQFTTNLKINLVSDRDALMSQEEYNKDEIHTIRFESVIKEMDIDLQDVLGLLRFNQDMRDERFKEWIICDFDGYLNENPYLS